MTPGEGFKVKAPAAPYLPEAKEELGLGAVPWAARWLAALFQDSKQCTAPPWQRRRG